VFHEQGIVLSTHFNKINIIECICSVLIQEFEKEGNSFCHLLRYVLLRELAL